MPKRKEDTDARRAVLAEWDSWATKHITPGATPNGHDAMLFFGHLQKNRSDLLEFRYPGDKWQRVHGWLMSHRQVKD